MTPNVCDPYNCEASQFCWLTRTWNGDAGLLALTTE